MAEQAKAKTPPTKSTSAERAARTAENKRVQNQSVKSRSKTMVVIANERITGGDREKALAALTAAISSLDKSVKKRVLHLNTASRRKAALMKKFNKAYGKEAATVTKPPEKKKTTKKTKTPKEEAK